MKKSSKLGGVRGVAKKFPEGYRAYWQKRQGLSRSYEIGIFDTIEAAARAWDAFVVSRLGIEAAYSQLNFPAEYEEQYEAHKRLQVEQAERDAQARENELRGKKLDPKDYQSVREKSYLGVSIQSLADAYSVHELEITRVLRLLEEQRLASIGLSPVPVEPVSKQSIRDHIFAAFRAGGSIRSISEQLGLDRRFVSRLLGKGDAESAGTNGAI